MFEGIMLFTVDDDYLHIAREMKSFHSFFRNRIHEGVSRENALMLLGLYETWDIETLSGRLVRS